MSSQNAFYEGDFELALEYIEAALDLFETDYGLALKGTVLYMLGQKEAAMELWQEANRRNPGIGIPDMEVLDQLLSYQ